MITCLLLSVAGWSQSYTFRYVNNADGKGAFGNDGFDWDHAKSNLQNAIDDAYEELQKEGNENMLGYIYVAGAKPEGNVPGQVYVPTRRSTDDADGTLFNTSFRVYERIYIFGGFTGEETPDEGLGQETLPGKRIMENGRSYAANEALIASSSNVASEAVRRWNFKYKTILSGNHSLTTPTFTYDDDHGRYNTNFPLSSYHVVWFATNGKIGTTGHFQPLKGEACIDGCTISEGNASGTDYNNHGHIGYGGGAYMVKNSLLRNCIVERCAANIRGGGVYMDGGGEVERCYIHTCQSMGVGVSQGYGGAVCIDYDGNVEHSYIIQSSARIGAGLAICHVPSEYPFSQVGDGTLVSSYSPFATATVIANCTSTAEGGGVYLDQGGTLNHCTVTNNSCVGPDVFYYGRRHGRTGGIYVNTRGTIYNTVAWGNLSPVNNNVQFASYRSDNAPEDAIIAVYHSAFSNHDISDWSSATKEAVISLNTDNNPETAAASGNYPIFRSPTPSAGIISDENGVVDPTATDPGEAYQRVYNWHPRAASALRMKAVQVSSAIQGASANVLHAHTTVDVIGRAYEPISCIGALAQSYRKIVHALVQSQERGETEMIPTLFVDPNRKVYGETNTDTSMGYLDDEDTGNSWEWASGNLANAVNHFRQLQVTDRNDDHFLEYLVDGTYYKHVQILVKEGTLTTAGVGAYLGSQARTAAIRPTSGMRLYGGFASSKTGTATSDRNQRKTPTRLNANVLNSTYMNNAAHVFALSNVRDVVIDGFRLYSGNANLSTSVSYSDQPIQFGGGLIVNNATAAPADRIDMTGNIIRNCVFSNCSAPEGAAIYVNGSYPNPETGRNCKAELTVINCIMRNSTAGDMHGDHEYFMEGKGHMTDAGVVTANGNAHIWLRNCDIVNNCGYALKGTNRPSYGDRYQIEIYNSIIFSNGRMINTDRTNIHNPVSCLWNDERTIIGNYIYLDYDANKPEGLPSDIKCFNILTRVKAKDMTDNPNWEEGYPEELKKLRYPYFINPSRNVGHSEDTDKPLYGGTVNYEPMNMNPVVNGAKPLDKTYDSWTAEDDKLEAHGDDTYNVNCKTIAYDSGFFTRDYGGDPDAGAIENTKLPEAGAVLYVTQNGAGRMDGSSWSNAIAGNLVYRVGDSYVVDETNGDGADHTVTTKNNLYRGGYAIDYVFRTGKTTYVDKQTVTQKRINLTYDANGKVTVEDAGETVLDENENTITISNFNTLTRSKTEFIYGEKSGASRNFYRTNVIDSKISSTAQLNNNNGYQVDVADIAITNNRDEDYVSGLQFAVEKAAALNKGTTSASDRVQVWVGSGTYEDYKGFVMRDKVEVFGGFPTSNNRTPGMSERHALVSEDVPLSELNASLKDKKNEYETILQPIDIKPYNDDWGFVDDVILYKDKDYTETGDKTITTETAVTIPVYYRRDSSTGDYYEVKGDNIEADFTSKILNSSFEQGRVDQDWKSEYARLGWTMSSGTLSLTAGTSNKTVHGGYIQKNTNFELYQDIESLEEGLYRVSCQAARRTNTVEVYLTANGVKRLIESNTTVNAAQTIDLFVGGSYDTNWVDVYVGSSGHLRIGLKGKTGNGNDDWVAFDNFRLERLSGSEASSTTTTVNSVEYTSTKKTPTKYSTFRKPVLAMPDVCMTTRWPGSIKGNADNQSNAVRWQKNADGTYSSQSGRGLQVYTDAHWDGFTIRNGFYYDYFANRDGGAGVRMFEGGTLENCVVVDNANMGAIRQRGGGGYCDGRTSKVIGCFFVNNLNSGIRHTNPESSNDKDTNGGGIYLLVGTCYNSLFANNICWGNDSRGAGIYIEQATFYNNTVAYNTCRKRAKTTVNTSKGNGVHQYEGSNSGATLTVFNTIFYGNTGPAIGSQDPSKLTKFQNCYIKSESQLGSKSPLEKKITNWSIFVDCILNDGSDATVSVSAPDPFEQGDQASVENNYRLKSSSLCINRGLIPEDQAATFPNKDVDFADRIQDCQVDIGAYEYDGTKDIEPDLTTNPDEAIFYVSQNGDGVANAKSPVNAACMSKLQKVLDAAGRWKYAANYYSEPASSDRYVDNNFTREVLLAELTDAGLPASELTNLKNRTVIVKLAGDYTDEKTGFSYEPTRSTSIQYNSAEDNVLEYSFIIPHGIQVKGGYRADEVAKTDDSGEKWPAFAEETRNIIGYPTRLSGNIYNQSNGTNGQVFHVVTFTDNLFDTNERLFLKDENYKEDLLADAYETEAEKHRAVLDGLFIQDGSATGTTSDERCGGAGVVTGFAHVSNCVIQNNTALENGGGLYLKPAALISGCIVKDNSADMGGGIYVYEPDRSNGETIDQTTWAHIYNTTVVGNTATTRAGGLFFQSNLRANSSAFWKNSANDLNNVAGSFSEASSSSAQGEVDYPFTYCGVESRRIAGVNNVDLPPEETNGMRWDHNDMYETSSGSDVLYFPITMSSVLSRAGMTYAAYSDLLDTYPTLSLTDIMGLKWMKEDETGVTGSGYTKVKKDNAFIEMGARVLNLSFKINVDPNNVMRRLFVTTTDLLPSREAKALQDLPDGSQYAIYKQMGSTFANPFHRLGDAFEYIMEVRKSEEEVNDPEHAGQTIKLGELYRNKRFEVFVTRGTYYPYRNAYGHQGDARTNTFVIPEGVTLMGGVDNTKSRGHWYCQEGFDYDATLEDVTIDTGTDVGTITLNGVKTQDIRDDRDHTDKNGNFVMEPWELSNQTILSGNAVNRGEKTNVYHVITCLADEGQVGLLPKRYSKDDETTELPALASYYDDTSGKWIEYDPKTQQKEMLQNLQAESQASKDNRSIIIDGLTIQEGHANDIEESYVLDDATGETRATQLTYFRGGGILVEGNWDNNFLTQEEAPEVLGVAKRDIPLMVTNCLFQNNQAGNGGALYTNGSIGIIGCRFTQNLSRGPDTSNDQKYIPWTAGGAIAANYTCDVWNTLFDNNEAQKGDKPIISGGISGADARQGSGGVISASETSVTRVHNCNLVRNKAVQFPAIYNFLDNGTRNENAEAIAKYGPGYHFALNTIFWGNRATATTIVDAEGDDAGSRKPYHVANFGKDLDQEVLYFCAYEDGYGLPATTPMPEDMAEYGESDEAKAAAQQKAEELREAAKKAELDDYVNLQNGTIKLAEKFSYNNGSTTFAYNHNQILNSNNEAADGPFFTLPSMFEGIDGYMENADWLVTRLNALIDNGWSCLRQEVTKESGESSLLTTRLYVIDEDGTKHTQDNAYNSTVYPGKMDGDGFYNSRSWTFYDRFHKMGFGDILPIGDKPYMKYIRDGETEDRPMRRISTHPKSGVQDVVIDIGIYEYQYVQLTAGGDETDVVWVAVTEDPSVDSDGSTWKKATSNLQGAIDMLLLSRNNHDKVLKIRGGEYSPNTLTSNNKQAFFIRTNNITKGNVTMPSGRQASDHYGVRSLTIKGGYSNNYTADNSDGEDQRDIEANRVTLIMEKSSTNTDDQLDHLFLIEDVEQKLSYGDYMGDANNDYSDYVIPLVFDGLTFVNEYSKNQDQEGGAALFYRHQFKTSVTGDKTDQFLKPGIDLNEQGVPLSGAKEYHKLIIKNCTFKNNGAIGGVSAVRIKRGGGQALVVNSLFHDNNGNPLEAANTQVVNCTFAQNAGYLTLDKEKEIYDDTNDERDDFQIGLYNSLIWKENGGKEHTQFMARRLNESNGYDDYLETFKSNNWMMYNAISGLTKDAYNNIPLDDDNRKIYVGPNFTDPDHGDFHVKPSAPIINQGNIDKYLALVPYYPTYPDYLANRPNSEDENIRHQYAYQKNFGTTEKPVYVWFQSEQRGDKALLTEALMRDPETKTEQKYTEVEVAGVARVKGDGLDRGAFESTAAIERVAYVMDGADGKEDGTSWENAYPIDKLQDAIDAASIYSFLSPDDAKERAFVFVKGSSAVLNDGNTVKLREGVTVYGGIGSRFMEEAVKDRARDGETELTKYSDATLNIYVRTMKAARDGVATKGASTSTITGMEPDNDLDYDMGFHVNGFWINGGERATAPVYIDRDNIIVSNCVITGNTVTTSEPVVKMTSGLLYNSLLFGNSTSGPAVSLGDDYTKDGNRVNGGYMLNCTVVTDGTTGVTGSASHQASNIVQPKSYAQFAPYMNTTNAYTLPDYLTSWEPYRYQLVETASDINGSADNGTASQGGIDIAQKFRLAGKYQQDSGSPAYYVYFDSDLDVLGNPRRLGGKVDNGCFETWKVEGNKYATTETDASFSNYGGHLYPHRGSVVYIMENANLVVESDCFTEDAKLVPGYLLVKKGGSLYGQGNYISADYVAVEKTYDAGKQYYLTALPYPVRHTSETVTAMTYDGEKRSTWNREFMADNSDCWVQTDLDEIPANLGWLMDRGEGASESTLRFTGWRDADETEAAYSESGESKTVTLKQYNSNEVTTNDYPHFTKAEHMGWNLVGMPWLVSDYQTSPFDDDTYQMNVPHIFYLMNHDGTYGDGTILTQQSWAASSSLSLGDGFLTQTAIIGDEEELTFKLPTYTGETAEAPARQRLGIIRQAGGTRTEGMAAEGVVYDDVVDVYPQAEADARMDYRLGADGYKWMSFNERLAQLYVQNAVGTRLSLVSAAPVETDIPLGVYVPDEGDYTICLPEPEAYSGYSAVWVIDQRTGAKANLLSENFVLTTREAGNITNRLILRFGSMEKSEETPVSKGAPSILKVAARNGRIPLRGIGDGEHIEVFNAGGTLQFSGFASELQQKHLPDGIYIIRRK